MSVSIPTISIKEALEEDPIYIDVRSPAEYEEFHIPGAINVPIFTNDERAEVGTVYKQIGQPEAVELGIEIFSKKLPDLYKEYKRIVKNEKHRKIVVYCWRGGMRSGTIVTFMAMIGLPLMKLEGGIRSYRQLIQEELKAFSMIERHYIVLEGNTGTHKTDILQELQRKNYPVIDLEGLANHRGSIFGGIGLSTSSQKEFERDLWLRLMELKDSPYVIIEAESRRVGRINLPAFILNGKLAGTRIHIDSPIESRIKSICETYQFDNYRDEFLHALEMIKKRLKPALYELLFESFKNRDYELFVKLMLEDYYDPKYTFAADQYDTPIYYITILNAKDGFEKTRRKIHEINDKKGY